MVTITINQAPYEVPANSSVLTACIYVGIFVPSLCFHPDLPPYGHCGLCLVEVDGTGTAYSCMHSVREGMVVTTTNPELRAHTSLALDRFLDLSVLPQSDEVEALCSNFVQRAPPRSFEPDRTHSITFDPDQCVNCGRCQRMCVDVQQIGALTENNLHLSSSECISCGQCVIVCPTFALRENSSISRVLSALAAGKVTILQTAPAVRVSIGEAFEEPIGSVVTGKIVGIARAMGFRYVLDTNFGADLTIVEEATELIARLTHNGILPMFTSCCPAWVNFVEKLHPEIIPHLSSCKSPHMMVAAVVRPYFAVKQGVKPTDCFVVSLMPCVAKKDEIERLQMKDECDAVITAREFIRMMEMMGIDWVGARTSAFDDVMGRCSGGGAIFGVTGGVTEAAVRYAYEVLTRSKLRSLEFKQWRGARSLKTADIRVGGHTLRIAVCSGIAAARELIESGKFSRYTFVEVMACRGGCVSGGGQPKTRAPDVWPGRSQSLFAIDGEAEEKVSGDNPQIMQLYKEFLGEPGGELAHRLLHTHFEPQETVYLAALRESGLMQATTAGQPLSVVAGSVAQSVRSIQSMRSDKGVYDSFMSSQLFASTRKAPAKRFMEDVAICTNPPSVAAMTKAKRVVFILTPQEGDEQTVALLRELDETTEDMTAVMYAVCAFQNKKTKYQSHIASQLDSALEQRLANRIVRTIEIDTSTDDQGEAAFHRWALALCTTLGLPVPELAIAVVFKLSASRDNSIVDSPLRPRGFEMARLKGSSELCPENCGYGLTQFAVKLPFGLGFRTGSRALVLPRNPGAVVSAVASALSVDLDQPYRLRASQNSPDLYIPDQVTPRHLFDQYIDLSAAPTRPLVKAFAGVVDPQTQAALHAILDGDFVEFGKTRTVADFIQQYAPHGTPRLDAILTSSPFIVPRRFTVASSPKKGRGYLEFLAEADESNLCYRFLNALGKGRLAIRLEDGRLDHPKDKGTPMILIAVGVGIGPIFGLLELRKYSEGPWGPVVVICEFRKKAHAPIIQGILQDYIEAKLITAVIWAFSEETDASYRTWQDVILNNRPTIWPAWMDDRSRVYLVGKVGDALPSLKKFFVQMTMDEGGLRDEEAMAWTDRHVIFVEDLLEGKGSGN